MHVSEQTMNSLSDYYVMNRLLTDSLLKAKQHMAACDTCYSRFCRQFLIKRELKKNGLYMVTEDTKVSNIVLSIRQELSGVKKIICDTIQGMEDALLWRFAPVYAMGTRGEDEVTELVNEQSEDTKIFYDGEIITITLDGDVIAGSDYRIEVVDSETGEQILDEITFDYDEDTQLYEAKIPIGHYDREITVNIVKKTIEE